MPKQRRKTETTKKRISPTNKRKTPGKVPKLDNYVKDRLERKCESPPKFTGLMYASIENTGSFIKKHENTNDGDDVKSDDSNKYKPLVSFPNVLQ